MPRNIGVVFFIIFSILLTGYWLGWDLPNSCNIHGGKEVTVHTVTVCVTADGWVIK
jgi:hypothetical protein